MGRDAWACRLVGRPLFPIGTLKLNGWPKSTAAALVKSMIRKSGHRFAEKDHAQTRSQSAMAIQPNPIAL
jgi:hypothetical protein